MKVQNAFDVDYSIDIVGLDMAPFDVYSLNAFAFAIDPATNESVPTIAFAVGDGPDHFAVSSFGVEGATYYNHYNGSRLIMSQVDGRAVRVTVKRSQLAQAFTMCLLLVNSALAIGSIYVTFLVLFRREAADNAVLLLPVTIILTIPALRDLYPGSPPFGIYLGRPPVFRYSSDD